MTTCVYDNPATMAREAWKDGKLVAHMSFLVLPDIAKNPPLGRSFPFFLNVGPWQAGAAYGDKSAIGEVSV